jgi:phage terminase large subunit-like protein
LVSDILNIDEKIESCNRQELIELIELTEHWADKKDCKFYLYTPNDVPYEFHKSIAKLRALFGGNRSSKTYSHVADFACQFVGEAPDSLKGLIPPHRLDQRRRLRFCCEDYPNAFEKVVWPYFKDLIPSDYIKDVVKSQGRIRAITNAKGGFIEFMFYDQLTAKHAGASRHQVGYDEPPPSDIRDEGLMRLVDTDGEESFSLTPVAGALGYLYNDIFLKRGREVEKNYDIVEDTHGNITDAIPGNLVDKVIPGGNRDIDVFFACIFDNIAIKKEAAIRILNNFPAAERIMRSKGHFMFLSGLVFNQYSDTIHLIPTNDEWVRSPHYTLYISIDTHPRTPHAVLFLAARSDGTLFIVDELYVHAIAKDFVNLINAKCRGKNVERILIDPIANTPDPATGRSLKISLCEAGLDPIPTEGSKDLSGGIIEVQNALTPVPLEVPIHQRNPLLYIMDNCVRTRKEIVTYSWDDWRHTSSDAKGSKQKPIDKDDHMMENLRRLVTIHPQWVREAPDYNSKVVDISSYRNRQLVGRSASTGY